MTDRLMIQFARGFSADDQMDDLRGQHPQAKRSGNGGLIDADCLGQLADVFEFPLINVFLPAEGSCEGERDRFRAIARNTRHYDFPSV